MKRIVMYEYEQTMHEGLSQYDDLVKWLEDLKAELGEDVHKLNLSGLYGVSAILEQ